MMTTRLFNVFNKVTPELVHCTNEGFECKSFWRQVQEYKDAGATKHLDLFVCLHIPNERKSSPQEGKRLKDMGLVPGIPDYLILWQIAGVLHMGWLEFKSYKGKKPLKEVTQERRIKLLQPMQAWWRKYFTDRNIKHEIPLSAREGIDHLIAWGVLKV